MWCCNEALLRGVTWRAFLVLIRPITHKWLLNGPRARRRMLMRSAVSRGPPLSTLQPGKVTFTHISAAQVVLWPFQINYNNHFNGSGLAKWNYNGIVVMFQRLGRFLDFWEVSIFYISVNVALCKFFPSYIDRKSYMILVKYNLSSVACCRLQKLIIKNQASVCIYNFIKCLLHFALLNWKFWVQMDQIFCTYIN